MEARRKTTWMLAAVLTASAAGCGGASDHEPTAGHSGTVGRDGGQHALGADPKAEMKRIQHAGGGGAPSPGQLPGR